MASKDMESLGTVLDRFKNSANEALPNDSQCSICGYFDLGHPEVARILYARDPSGWLYKAAECKCRQAEAKAKADAEMIITQANLPNRHPGPRTFENYDPRAGDPDLLAKCQAFAKGQGAPVLLLTGEPGTGKSHLLEAIARDCLSRNVRSRYERVTDWLERLRNSYDDEEQNHYNLVMWYKRFSVLALDDLGMEKATEWAKEQVTAYVDDAIMWQRRLVIATNKTRDEMADHMGDRLASRLYGMNQGLGEVTTVPVVAEDYRDRR